MNNKIYKIIIFILLLAVLCTIIYERHTISDNIGIKAGAWFDGMVDEPVETPEPKEENTEPIIHEPDETAATAIDNYRVMLDEMKDSVDNRKPAEKKEYPKLYTMDDAYVIAKTVYGEAKNTPDLYIWDGRVISREAQLAAIVWGMCDRYEAGYDDTLSKIAGNPGQYHGYHYLHPVTDEILDVVLDVLERWNNEMHGETDVGRVIPKGYYWFVGDGIHNHFYNHYDYTRGVATGPEWDWSLGDPYTE